MNQTLFVIPHDWIPVPILVAWLVVASIGFIIFGIRLGWRRAARDLLPTVAAVAAIIYWLLPRMEVLDINPADPLGEFIPSGLAIRGYGTLLSLAILGAVGLIVLRCRQLSERSEDYLSLCFWIIICGLLAARLFYVFQKWDEFAIRSLPDFFVAVTDMARGGLVVYGSFLGALIAIVVFVRRRKMPLWRTLDILAPAMTLGLAIGRLGCLMNGCCFGGLCDPEFVAGVTFPAGTPPYMRQLERGTLLGVRGGWNSDSKFPIHVEQIEPGSVAERIGVKPGDDLAPISIHELLVQSLLSGRIDGEFVVRWPLSSGDDSDRRLELSTGDLPPRSLRVHPTQIYASITAFLLTALLWVSFSLRRFDGQVFCLLLILYGVARFLEESIRDDEFGWMGTPFTISQWISIFGVVAGFALWIYLSGWKRSTR